MGQCSRLLKPIINHPKALDFRQPVDWKKCAPLTLTLTLNLTLT